MHVMLSVVICTYNRAERLRETLESLRKIRTPAGIAWELLLIDNNSSDDTKAVALGFARHFGWALRYIFEEKAGLCHARNRGVKEARGEIIAFTDDDCIADHNWIKAIWEEFANDPELAVLGG